MTIPLSLACSDGSLHTANKSILADVLSNDVETPSTLTLPGSAALLIDGQALEMGVGKSAAISTFGDYAESGSCFGQELPEDSCRV